MFREIGGRGLSAPKERNNRRGSTRREVVETLRPLHTLLLPQSECGLLQPEVKVCSKCRFPGCSGRSVHVKVFQPSLPTGVSSSMIIVGGSVERILDSNDWLACADGVVVLRARVNTPYVGESESW